MLYIGVERIKVGRSNQKETDAEIARRLVAFLEANDANAKSNLRQRERSTYSRTVDLILISQVGHPQITGFTRNLSSGGVGILTRRMFKQGERFVTLFNMGDGFGKYALCRVTFCRYVSDCMYELGAQFEATAPRLNSNHLIPDQWIALARNHTPSAVANEKSPLGNRLKQ